MDPVGYKQVNSLLNAAYMQILKNNHLTLIEEYNAGFGGPATTDKSDSDECLRTWDSSQEPVGILAEAIDTGKFIWCFTEYDLGPASEGLIDVALEDNFLQGVKAGEYFGFSVDLVNSLTNTMSMILGKPLCPELYFKAATEKGIFYDTVDAMEANLCYATTAQWYR